MSSSGQANPLEDHLSKSSGPAQPKPNRGGGGGTLLISFTFSRRLKAGELSNNLIPFCNLEAMRRFDMLCV